jgi:hypothetical protein
LINKHAIFFYVEDIRGNSQVSLEKRQAKSALKILGDISATREQI